MEFKHFAKILLIYFFNEIINFQTFKVYLYYLTKNIYGTYGHRLPEEDLALLPQFFENRSI